MTECHICSGQQTVESAIQLQLVAEQTGGVRPVIALCRQHIKDAEEHLAMIRKIQSPPVVVNVSGVRAGGSGGNR